MSHDVLEVFGAIYEIMLQILSRFFAHSGEDDEQLYILHSAFVNLMDFGLSPLGAAITRLPAGPQYPGRNAGPSFEIFSDVQLLPQLRSAWSYFEERLDEIARACAALASDASTQAHGDLRTLLTKMSGDLEKVAFTFSLGLDPPAELTWSKGISQLFSPVDVAHMAQLGRDLADLASVKKDADLIHEFVEQGIMPPVEPLGRWSAKRVAFFKRWIEQGFPE